MYFNKETAGKETPIIVPLPKEDDLQDPRPGWVTTARTWSFREDWLTDWLTDWLRSSDFTSLLHLWAWQLCCGNSTLQLLPLQRSITCLLQGPENCASSASLGDRAMQIFLGFPCVQQVATDGSAFGTWTSRHLPNTSGVCIPTCSLCPQGAPHWVLGLPPSKRSVSSVLTKTHTTEQKKAELIQTDTTPSDAPEILFSLMFC